jgi:hypothetical protein
MKTAVLALACAVVCLVPTNVRSQGTPVVPEDVWQALANELSGDIAFDHLRYLTLYHSPNAGSEGFQLSAEWVARKAGELGLVDVKMLSLSKPTRGSTLRAGEAWILSPFELKLGDVRETPLRVATNSHSTDVTAELIDIGAGDRDADYQGKKVKGKIVLASGEPSRVHELAVWSYGAAGVISFGTRRRAYPDQLPWHHIREMSTDDGRPSTFAWILTEREGHELRAKIEAADQPIRARVTIEAEFGESTEGIVEGWIRGADPSLPSVLLVAHLQEEKTSANDNRSGCASLLEIGRSLSHLIQEGKLTRPRRDIRFWWVDEIRAPYQYFAEKPNASQKILVAFNQDMVGAKLSLGPRSVILGRTPFSRPSFLNDVAVSVLEAVRDGNTLYPFTRGNTDEGDFLRPLVSTLGTREPYHAMAVPFYNNTDHMVFNDGRVGIPAVALDNWPDPFIHSIDDDLWQIDPTQLQRNAFVVAATAYAVASIGEPEVSRLAALMLGGAQKRLSRDSASALIRLEDASAGTVASRYRDAAMLVEVAASRELATIDSAVSAFTSPGSAGEKFLVQVRGRVERLARTLREDVDQFFRESTGQAPPTELSEEEKAAAERVPEWAVRLGELGELRRATPVEGMHEFYAYEVRNLIDGERTVLDIYRIVRATSLSAGEWYYGPVKLGKVVEVLEAAEKAGAVRFVSGS